MRKRYIQVVGLIFAVFLINGCGAKHVAKLDPIIYTHDKAQILFYRDASSDRPVTLMVEDRIVGVIKSNQYLETSVCSGKFPVRISTRVDDKMYERNTTVDVPSKSMLYIFVDTTKQLAEPKVVNISSKENITKGKSKGTYVVNRYVPNCLKYMDISADALFAFDSSSLRPEGKEKLTKLAEVLQAKSVQAEQMIIEGHTDRIGSVAYNNKLSLSRAQSVISYLKSQGVTTPMVPRGMGKSTPVTDGCHGVTPTEKLKECLQPDRRVRIEFVGKSYNAIKN
ncbi:MAG: OmpA family protein [Sulfurimonas sp.]|uniref:OmpA family protein n=1 Tax=Sulfurimonas sp. TaxID=2022749 RepID=UPI0026272F92|nr:OmpA family protein [Sulfurimonas sp.]MDD2653027.1 OmpA family protein [Sulfurimonas sp.]MDD3452280.1 OmpA family protein [Sulfurimonas sp.]